MRKIARPENADAQQKTPEGRWERLQAEEEGSLRPGRDGPFADEQPERGDGN